MIKNRIEHIDLNFSIADMVSVPDYVATAVENWGLFFFQEITLLYGPQESSASDKQRVAVWVSHELAHLVYTQ